MRILHVITGLGQGGAENALIGLCRDLGKRDIHLRVVSLGAGNDRVPDFTNAGIDTIELATLGLPSILGQLRKQVRDFAPDVVHCWMYHPILLAPFFIQNIPFVAGIRASLQSLHTEKLTTRVIIRACALTSRCAGATVYNSRIAALEHQGIGYPSRNSLVIPNGFNLDDFKTGAKNRYRLRKEAGIGQSEIVIGHAGRFHAVKNQIGMVEAAGILNRRGLQFRLVLAGTSVDGHNKLLTDAIRSAGIVQQTILLGPVSPITDMLSLCDVYVNASLGEAFPNTVAEALAMEIPVVATNAGDSASIVGDAGLVVRSADPRDLADSIDTMLRKTPEDRAKIGVLARERIASYYSQESVTKAYVELYRATLARDRRER